MPIRIAVPLPGPVVWVPKKRRGGTSSSVGEFAVDVVVWVLAAAVFVVVGVGGVLVIGVRKVVRTLWPKS